MYNSRLQRNFEKKNRRQIAFFAIGSVIALIILFAYGIPLLFNLTTAISTLRHGNTVVQKSKDIAPSKPEFAQNFQATPSSSIKISGVADPKTTIEIFQNSRSLGTNVSQDDGSFSLDVDLEKGINTFTAVAINESGLKSDVSESYSVSLLTGKPKLEIGTPKDGDTTNNSSYSVVGQTDPGNTVSINDRLIIVNKDGKFSYDLNLNDGDNKLKLIATDMAGNQTTKEVTLKYQH
ncbi:hypothetical protein HY310_03515 [Candidatus Microgenomates bacterium]|nr:hypothetical protein [Candidatus Microgenomates bacterium]